MKKNLLFSSAQLLGYGRHCVLLVVLSGAASVASAQSFAPVRTYSVGTGSSLYTVAVGDVSGDGRPDIVTVDFNSGNVLVLRGQAGGFAAVTTYANNSGGGPQGVAVGDVNGDGRADIVVANAFASNVGVLLQQAGGSLAPVSFYSTGGPSSTAPSSAPRGVALGDVNGDGRIDIVTANGASDNVGVLLGLAGGGFAAVTTYSTGTLSIPYGVALGDVNGDGRMDIVSGNDSRDDVGVLLGLASGGFAPASFYATGQVSRPSKVALGDVNGDGRPDIVTLNVAGRGVAVLLGQAAGGFAAASTYGSGSTGIPSGVALGDVSGDGRLDIAIANGGANNVAVLTGQASGFAAPQFLATGAGTEPLDVVVADVDGDGRRDIITAHYNTGTIGVLLNSGTFLSVTRPATAAEVLLYPNPARTEFTVRVPEALGSTSLHAELLNSLGQVLRVATTAVGARDFSIATSRVPAGVYTLRLQNGATALTKRVVIE